MYFRRYLLIRPLLMIWLARRHLIVLTTAGLRYLGNLQSKDKVFKVRWPSQPLWLLRWHVPHICVKGSESAGLSLVHTLDRLDNPNQDMPPDHHLAHCSICRLGFAHFNIVYPPDLRLRCPCGYPQPNKGGACRSHAFMYTYVCIGINNKWGYHGQQLRHTVQLAPVNFTFRAVFPL